MQVIWNTEAVQQLDRLLDYVGQEFGQRVMQSLYTRLLSYEPLLAANPGMGRKEPLLEGHPKGFRSLVVHKYCVHKYCKIIYYVDGDTLYIADLWDTRREPRAQAGDVK